MTPTVSQVASLLKMAQSLWEMVKGSGAEVAPEKDREVAEASFKVLGATETGRDILDKIAALPEEEADKLWEEMLAHGLPPVEGEPQTVPPEPEPPSEVPPQQTKTSGK